MNTPQTTARLEPGHILKLVVGETCVQCKAAERALDAAGIDYEIIPRAELDTTEVEYLRRFGTQLPVGIPPQGEVWQGFRPDRIQELATSRA